MRFILFISILVGLSPLGNAQFNKIENPEEDFYLGAQEVVRSHGKLFTITGVLSGFDSDGVKMYVSEDEGETWQELEPESGFNNRNIEPRALFGNDSLLIFSARRQVIMSKDAGLNWTSLPDIASTRDEDRASVFAVIDDVILAGTADDTNNGGTGIYRKEGDGAWVLINEGLDNNEPNGSPNIVQISVNKGRVLVSASDGFYISDDKGLTYTRTESSDVKLEFAVHGDTILVNGNAGGRRDFAFVASYDNGETFEEIIAPQVLPEGAIYKAAQEDIVFDGEQALITISARNDSLDGGVWKSTNFTEWTRIGLAGVQTNYLFLSENKLFVSTPTARNEDKGLYAISREDILSTSSELVASNPVEFSLQQNYPNPFNPSTNIPFSLNQASEVTLEVYNNLGQKVAVLLDNQVFSGGAHQVVFDASGLPSGIYHYALRFNETSHTRQMTLIK